MKDKSYLKENCFSLAVTNDNLEMVKKLVALAEKYNSEENVVIDMFAPNSESTTAIGFAIEKKKMEMVKLLSNAKWNNGRIVNHSIKFYLEADDKDASDKQDLSFFESLFSVNNLSDIKWLDVFTWCTNCEKVNKQKYIEFILQLNVKHNGRLFDCDNTWKSIMRLNDYQMFSTLFSSASGSNKLIPKEYEFSLIQSNIKYWKLLKTFATQTISDNKANEVKIKSFELLLKQKQFMSLFKKDVFGEHGNDLVMYLLGVLANQQMPKWIKYFVNAINSTKWNVNKLQYQTGSIFNGLTNPISFGWFDVFKEIYNAGWYSVNLDEENSKKPLIVDVIQATKGFDKNQPLESPNFQIFEILLQDKNTNLLFEHPRYKWDLIGLCQMYKSEYIPFVQKRLQQIDRKKWSSTAIDKTIKKYKLANSIINAAKKSNYDGLKSILDENEDSEITDCINIVAENDTTALIGCIESKDGFEDDNQMKGENYKCFKLLISIKGIDVHAGGFDLASYCVANNKVAILKYLVDKMDMAFDGNPYVNSYENAFEECVKGSNLEMLQYLLKINKDKLKMFDWNRILYECGCGYAKFNRNAQRSCIHFLVFETIVNQCHEYLDVSGYISTGTYYSGYLGIVGALGYHGKYEYIEFLEEVDDKKKLGIQWNRYLRSPNVCGFFVCFRCVMRKQEKSIDCIELCCTIEWIVDR